MLNAVLEGAKVRAIICNKRAPILNFKTTVFNQMTAWLFNFCQLLIVKLGQQKIIKSFILALPAQLFDHFSSCFSCPAYILRLISTCLPTISADKQIEIHLQAYSQIHPSVGSAVA